jgi:glycosyltransferase involved in cell wall biosynthesis
MLRALATMPVSADAHLAHLHTLIVVDRPSASNVAEIQQLTSYAPGRVVRVHVMPENAGAAVARNVGLAQSFGDHCVLLDDDVIPQPGLLDAYLGAISRRPDAVGHVGVAKLTEARKLVEDAVLACRITFFYGIARVKEPPWGVTANLCVRSRTLPLYSTRASQRAEAARTSTSASACGKLRL